MVLNRHMGLPNLPGLSGGSHSKRSRRKAKSIYFLSKKIYHFVTRHTLSAVQMEMSCWDVCHTLCCSVVQDVCKRPFTTWPKDVHCRTAKADPSESSRAKKAAVAPGCQSHRQPKRPIFQGCSTQLLPFLMYIHRIAWFAQSCLGKASLKNFFGLGKTPSPPTQPSPPHSLRTIVNLHKDKDKRPKSLVTAGQFGQTGLPGQFGDPVSLISLVNRIILVIPVSMVTSLELGPVNQWLWFQSVKLFDFQSWWVFFISQTMGVACGGGMFNLIMQHFFANQHRPPHPESSSRDSGWIHKHLLSLKMGLYCITDYNKLNGENSDPQSKYLETVSKIFYSYPIYLNIWHWTSGPCGFLTGFPTSALNLLYFLWQSLKGSSR